jgi:hypothetical protein
MRKLKINITNKTDINSVLDNFRKDCLKQGLSDIESNNLFRKVEEITKDLVRRGQELNSIGSQFQVQRVIKIRDCNVFLNINFTGKQPSIMDKVRSLFSRGKA